MSDQDKERELKRYLKMIPQRILQLQFEIDDLKVRFKEVQEEYEKTIALRQREIVKALKHTKVISKEEFMKKEGG